MRWSAPASVDVIKALLENHGAQITDATMAYLVQQSESVDEFQEPLLRRKDLPSDLSKKMYLWVSAASAPIHRRDITPSTRPSSTSPSPRSPTTSQARE